MSFLNISFYIFTEAQLTYDKLYIFKIYFWHIWKLIYISVTTIKISKILFGLLWMPRFCPFILPFHPIHRENLRAVGKEGNRGWDDWMASLTQWTRYINGLVHNVYEWLFKQNTAILRLIHVIRYINSFFIFIAALYFVLYIFHKLFIYSLTYTYVSTFWRL